MGIKRHKPEEIVTKLRQVEVLCGRECRALMPFDRCRLQNRPSIAGASNMAVWELTN